MPKLTFPRKNGNPPMLSLLQMGARITFADGRYLEGKPAQSVMVAGSLGGEMSKYALDRDTLRTALDDLAVLMEI